MALTDKLTNIGNAIRTKTGGTDLIKLADMPNEILSIETGGAEPIVRPLNITSNGTYTAPNGVDGYNPVTVNVPQSSEDRSNCLWATGSWAEIQTVLDDYYAGNDIDLNQYFKVGDERTIEVGSWKASDESQSAGTYAFVIIGIEHDDLSSGEGKAALTIMKKKEYVNDMHIISKTTTTTASNAQWSNYTIRNAFSNFKNALPTELNSMIKTVKKLSTVIGSSSYVTANLCGQFESNDTIFLLSLTEATGLTYANHYYGDYADGLKYEYFEDDKPWLKFLSDNKTGLALSFALRNGYLYRSSSTSSYGVYYKIMSPALFDSSTSSGALCTFMPAFCI